MTIGIKINPKDWKPSEWLTPQVLSHYRKLIKDGDIQAAVDYIASWYPQKIAYKMIQSARKMIEGAISKELTEAQLGKSFSEINMLFRVSREAIISGTRLFTTNVIADSFFAAAGITEASLQTKILNACLGQFESYIEGAMANTQAGILADIRGIQREWITQNVNMRAAGSADDLLYKSEAEFRKMLETKYQNLFRAMEDGEVLRSRTYLDKNGNPKFKSYTLEEYTDFSVRATVLNVDRNSTEIAAHSDNHKVVQLYLRDNRPVKTEEREVCKHVLATTIHGMSGLLALTAEAGAALGIMTIDQARENGCMYIHCRHSIKQVSDELNSEIDKIIALNEAAGGGDNAEQGAA